MLASCAWEDSTAIMVLSDSGGWGQAGQEALEDKGAVLTALFKLW